MSNDPKETQVDLSKLTKSKTNNNNVINSSANHTNKNLKSTELFEKILECMIIPDNTDNINDD